MTSEDYQFFVNLVKERYQQYHLTYAQAELVYQFEKERDFSSFIHVFSEWEEWDFEWTTFRGIFNEDQWEKYEEEHNQRKKLYENNLIELDHTTVREIKYNEELINYYKTQFRPDSMKDPLRSNFALIDNEKSKVQYLKAEYKKYLKETKKMILTDHFRHYRTFRPNELRNSLLRHELAYVFPDYSYFKYQMDKPTRIVSRFLYKKLYHTSDDHLEFINQKYKELITFTTTLNSKYYGSESNIVYFGKLSAEEEKESRIMSLLLLDLDMYKDSE